jgi:ADP-heptose:LPS heptosyltransferase
VKPLPNDVVMEGDWGYSPDRKAQHYSARHQHFLQTLGATPGPYTYDIHLEPSLAKFTKTGAAPLLVINSQSSTENRSLSIKWLQACVTEILKQHPDIRIQLLSASLTHELEQKKAFSGLESSVSVVAFAPSVSVSLAVIRAADVVLSPDTYAVHAAGAWKIAVIALYESSSSTMDLWAPVSECYVQICAPEGHYVTSIDEASVSKALSHVLTHPQSRERMLLTAA